VDFDQQVYGGLQTDDPALTALKLSVLAPQSYTANVDATNTSGQITAAYKVSSQANLYGTFATGFKSVGLNLNGLPTDALGRPILSTATVKPEDVHNYEIGLKTTPTPNITANFAFFDTEIKDFQTQVTNGDVGVVRGYLANADKVRVRGAEFDSSVRVNRQVYVYGALAYTDGKYVSFPDAPPPIEDTGGPQFVDASGQVLPGISKWAISIGGEWAGRGSFFSRSGEYFAALDTSFRSTFSANASPSPYLMVPGYSLANVRFGFRVADGWTLSVWSRNLFNKDYYELMSVQPGNSGLYEAQPGDPRTAGVTLRLNLKSR
jgi:iron complex outermembrane recepter protein